MVKYPGLSSEGKWLQEEDCIVNSVPSYATPEQMCEGGAYAADTFCGMLWRESFDSPVRVASTLSFDYKMAPLLDIACRPRDDGAGLTLQERYEVVVYYEGVNVWEHFRRDGELRHRRILFDRRPLKAGERYRLEVGVNLAEKTLTVVLEGSCVTIYAPLLREEFYVGLMANEGINRFYNFEVTDYE